MNKSKEANCLNVDSTVELYRLKTGTIQSSESILESPVIIDHEHDF